MNKIYIIYADIYVNFLFKLIELEIHCHFSIFSVIHISCKNQTVSNFNTN